MGTVLLSRITYKQSIFLNPLSNENTTFNSMEILFSSPLTVSLLITSHGIKFLEFVFKNGLIMYSVDILGRSALL